MNPLWLFLIIPLSGSLGGLAMALIVGSAKAEEREKRCERNYLGYRQE